VPYRNGNYVAFDGLSQTNPVMSDFRYYAALEGWAAGKGADFKFVNSHDRTAAVRDTSLKETLKRRIRDRLALSKNVIVILSEKTRQSGSMLSYEIEKAVDTYSLPLICVYPGYSAVLNPIELSYRWPIVLKDKISSGLGTAIHIPFKKLPIIDAMGRFTVHTKKLSGGLNYYTLSAHRYFDCL